MLDIDEINEEIAMLEQCGTTYSTCQKLAILYIVRDHYKPTPNGTSMPASSARMSGPSMVEK